MRILALDHGAARIGCALCDPTETLVRPLGLVEPPTAQEAARIAAAEEAELIVVGLPVTLAGSEGEQAGAARAFADELASAASVPVDTYDERLTTRMAEATARAGADAPPDAIAAAHLLESYLQRRGQAASERPT
jgi:putative Holliday junction resolvase